MLPGLRVELAAANLQDHSETFLPGACLRAAATVSLGARASFNLSFNSRFHAAASITNAPARSTANSAFCRGATVRVRAFSSMTPLAAPPSSSNS